MEENNNNGFEMNTNMNQTNATVNKQKKSKLVPVLVTIILILVLALALCIGNMYAMTKDYDNVFAMIGNILAGEEVIEEENENELDNIIADSEEIKENNSNVVEEKEQPLKQEVQGIIQAFLNMEKYYMGHPSEVLIELGYVEDLIEYNQKSSRTDDGWLVSKNIKYSDFKNKMLGYMTEKLYQEKFTFYKDIDGYLALLDSYGKSGNTAKVDKIELVNSENDIYTYLVESTGYYNQPGGDTEEYKQKEVFEMKKNEKGKYVVSGMEYMTISNELLFRNIQGYLNIEIAYNGHPSEVLYELGYVKDIYEYNQNFSRTDDYWLVSKNIKYSDFKNKMLGYMTEELYKEKYTDYKEVDGYLAVLDNYGKPGNVARVEKIELVSLKNNLYTFMVESKGTYTGPGQDAEEYNIKSKFEVRKDESGKYIVSKYEVIL